MKRPDLLIDALVTVKDSPWTLTIVGDPLPKDEGYYQSLKEKCRNSSIEDRVVFKKGVSNTETPAIYNAHEIFVNLSSSGMYDKTIIEAMACGCLVLASNENLRGEIDDKFIFKEGDREELVEKLAALLALSPEEVTRERIGLQEFAAKHSLAILADRLVLEMRA